MEKTYEALGQSYKDIDKSHKLYLDLVNKAMSVAEGDYLEESLKLYLEAQVAYSCVLDKRAKAEVYLGIQSSEEQGNRKDASIQGFMRGFVTVKFSQEYLFC